MYKLEVEGIHELSQKAKKVLVAFATLEAFNAGAHLTPLHCGSNSDFSSLFVFSFVSTLGMNQVSSVLKNSKEAYYQ